MSRKRHDDSQDPTPPQHRLRLQSDEEKRFENQQSKAENRRTRDRSVHYNDPRHIPSEPPRLGIGESAVDDDPIVPPGFEGRRPINIIDDFHLHESKDKGAVGLRAFDQASSSGGRPRAFDQESSSEGRPGRSTTPYFDHHLQHLPSTSKPIQSAEDSSLSHLKIRLRNHLPWTIMGRRTSSKELGEQAVTEEVQCLMRDLQIYFTSHRQDKSVLPLKPKGFKTRLPRFTEGRVLVNHFIINYQPTDYFLYTVTWKDRTYEHQQFSKDIQRALWKKLIEGENADRKFENQVRHLVYDGGSLLISPTRFRWEEDTQNFEFRSRQGADNQPIEHSLEQVQATIKFDKACNSNEIQAFLGNTTLQYPQQVIQAGNLIMKQYLRQDIHEHGPYFESTGRFFYVSTDAVLDEDLDLSRLLQGKTGYFQSVRLLAAGLTLNVDVTTTAFYKVMRLSDAWRQMLTMAASPMSQEEKDLFRDFYRQDTPFSEAMVAIVNKYWKNMMITSTHRQVNWRTEPVKRYCIRDVVRERADLRVVTDFESNTDKPLNRLMAEKYSLQPTDLQGALPAIKVHKRKEHFLPWGCCYTYAAARFPFTLDENSLRKIQRNVGQRYESILRWIQYRYTTDVRNAARPGIMRNPETDKHYNLNIEYRDMLEVTSLSLADPQLEPVGNRNFARPARIEELWGVISFVQGRRRDLRDLFIKRLIERARERNMKWSESVVLEEVEIQGRASLDERRRRVRQHIRNITDRVQHLRRENPPPKLKLILCFMERKMSPEYPTLKYELDLVEGVPSQVIVLPTREHAIYSRLNNILLKINVKCGGQNFELSAETTRQTPLLRRKTILMGADVTHPSGNERGPSIAAVVATTDRVGVNYATRLRLQDGRVERLVQLQEMVEELLNVYKDVEGGYPDNIIFFRDGVSEQFFLTSLRYEGTAIMRAAEALNQSGEYRPKVAMILAIKRHHTRFFVFSNRQRAAGNPTNLPKGSVVADGVTHPTEYDFFLASHDSKLGTCRPTRYQVLLDQIDIQPDELYTLVYNLCWTFQRCNSSVSLVTPVYYAHVAAFRARLYVEVLLAIDRDVREIDAHPNLRNRLWYL